MSCNYRLLTKKYTEMALKLLFKYGCITITIYLSLSFLLFLANQSLFTINYRKIGLSKDEYETQRRQQREFKILLDQSHKLQSHTDLGNFAARSESSQGQIPSGPSSKINSQEKYFTEAVREIMKLPDLKNNLDKINKSLLPINAMAIYAAFFRSNVTRTTFDNFYKARNQRQPLQIAAHRGASYKYPPQTKIAFKKAAQVNADMLECDLHLTKDFKIICVHDPWLDYQTNIVSVFGNDKKSKKNKKHLRFWKYWPRHNYYSVDFTLEELKAVTVIQDNPLRDQSMNEKYNFVTLRELFDIMIKYNLSTLDDRHKFKTLLLSAY